MLAEMLTEMFLSANRRYYFSEIFAYGELWLRATMAIKNSQAPLAANV